MGLPGSIRMCRMWCSWVQAMKARLVKSGPLSVLTAAVLTQQNLHRSGR
jgi:hypothetical protein